MIVHNAKQLKAAVKRGEKNIVVKDPMLIATLKPLQKQKVTKKLASTTLIIVAASIVTGLSVTLAIINNGSITNFVG